MTYLHEHCWISFQIPNFINKILHSFIWLWFSCYGWALFFEISKPLQCFSYHFITWRNSRDIHLVSKCDMPTQNEFICTLYWFFVLMPLPYTVIVSFFLIRNSRAQKITPAPNASLINFSVFIFQSQICYKQIHSAASKCWAAQKVSNSIAPKYGRAKFSYIILPVAIWNRNSAVDFSITCEYTLLAQVKDCLAKVQKISRKQCGKVS